MFAVLLVFICFFRLSSQGGRWSQAREAGCIACPGRPIEGRPVHLLLHEYHRHRVQAQVLRGAAESRETEHRCVAAISGKTLSASGTPCDLCTIASVFYRLCFVISFNRCFGVVQSLDLFFVLILKGISLPSLV